MNSRATQAVLDLLAEVDPPYFATLQEGSKPTHTFYEFFAGGGMARAGLGPNWRCLFANDFDLQKSATYLKNWCHNVTTKDVADVDLNELPAHADTVWASFPCQDLSLAGMGAGLKGNRSGTFWAFWKLVGQLSDDGRKPRVVVLENVCGTLTSHEGKDFLAIAQALTDGGYRYGAVVIDAVDFVPQSRPRLFIVGVDSGTRIPSAQIADCASSHWHPKALRNAYSKLKGDAKANWLWWQMPQPAERNIRFVDLIEENPSSVSWHTPAETTKLLAMMSELNLKKVEAAKKSGELRVGAVYKRTRFDREGCKVQRAEVRFDDIAGCLRTSSGGSSRQLIVVVKGKSVRSRLLSSREAARLMGLPDDYKLPENYNEAYHLLGDGLVVPAVRHLAENLLEPLLAGDSTRVAPPWMKSSPASKIRNSNAK